MLARELADAAVKESGSPRQGCRKTKEFVTRQTTRDGADVITKKDDYFRGVYLRK